MAGIEALYGEYQTFGAPVSACVACGSRRIGLWKQKSFAASAHAEIQAFNIFRCAECGTGFLNPPPADDYLKKVYAVSGHGLTRPITLAEVEEMERQFPNSAIDARRMASWADKANRSSSRRALDVGSGYGWGTRALLDRGYEVVALNPGAFENDVFRQMNHFSPIVGMFADFQPEGRFGVVYLSQVLEHMVDPRAMVRRIVEILEPGGALVIAVPNFQSFSVKLFGTRDQSCLWVPEHVNYFTRRGLVALLQGEGLLVGSSCNISRVRYDALSRRLGLSGFPGRLARLATRWGQILPCRVADMLGSGIYLNVVAIRPAENITK